MNPWKALGRAIKRRRTDLRLDQTEAAQRADVSLAKWGQLERATQSSYRDGTLARVNGALYWLDDTAERIVAGAIAVDDAGRIPTDHNQLANEIRDRVRASVDTPTGLEPDEQLAALNAEMTPEKRARWIAYGRGLLDADE